VILLISTSQVHGITDISHRAWSHFISLFK
jgi:hypothetical protein